MWCLLLAGLAGWGGGWRVTALRAQQPSEPFVPGDVIRLVVEGDSTLSGIFTVGPGPALTLPVIGEISLVGVRRADLESQLRERLGRYLRNPIVHAKALIRLMIVGEVNKPGVYAVSTDQVLADALTVAGGPTPGARVTGIRIERGDRRFLEGDRLQAALARGMTVDDLNLRAGDRIVVPRLRDPESTWRILGFATGSLLAVYGILRLSK
jgi:polysaccharide export outer membrane protein